MAINTLEAPPQDSLDQGEIIAKLSDLKISLERKGVRREILHGIDLEIRRGEILAVVGESGSGKSVMSMGMMGLLPESSKPIITGKMEIAGMDMLAVSKSELRSAHRNKLGVIFQDPMTSLNPTMHVGKQIMEKSGTYEEAIRMMNAVGIPEPERRFRAYPHELSGGLRQRIMIAMAVAGKPELVVADEPTTALDVTVQAQVLDLLLETREKFDCSMVFITHDLGVAAQIADRIAVMYQGELVEVGTAEEILDHPKHPYTKGLLGSRLTLTTDRTRPLPTMQIDEPVTTPKPASTAAIAHNGEFAEVDVDTWRPLVSLEDVECVFNVKDEKGRKTKLHALRGVTLYVQPGESVAIVGESGSGKSTMLRIAGLLEKRFTGEVDAPSGTDVQMVFQDPGSSLTPWLTIRDMLFERLPRKMSTADKEAKAAAIIERVGLPTSVLDARPRELSGGQRQRVVIARATIIPPKLLLCDEPTSALDVSVAASVLNLINELRRELGITVIFVTHDLAVARIISDRIAVVHRGKIVELGEADQVINNPRVDYTRELIAAIPSAKPRGAGANRASRKETNGTEEGAQS